jgi:hypothetical protein
VIEKRLQTFLPQTHHAARLKSNAKTLVENWLEENHLSHPPLRATKPGFEKPQNRVFESLCLYHSVRGIPEPRFSFWLSLSDFALLHFRRSSGSSADAGAVRRH